VLTGAGRRGFTRIIGLALCAALALCACAGDQADEVVATVDADVAPFDLYGIRMFGAALGNGAVFVDSQRVDSADGVPTVRYDSGRWTSLGELPGPFAAFDIASAGAHAIAAGVSCPETCDLGGTLEFFRLGPDDDEWQRLDDSFETTAFEPWVAAVPGRGELAIINTNLGQFAVDESGQLERIPTPTGRQPGASIACQIDGQLLALNSAITNLTEQGPTGAFDYRVTTVEVLDLDDPTTWERLPLPEGDPPGSGAPVCTATGVTMLDGTTATSFDLATRTWSASTVELDGADVQLQSIGPASAIGPDDTLYTVAADGRVLRRDGAGAWTVAEATIGGVLATHGGVLLVTSPGRTVEDLS
jgi:hypothetical protein